MKALTWRPDTGRKPVESVVKKRIATGIHRHYEFIPRLNRFAPKGTLRVEIHFRNLLSI